MTLKPPEHKSLAVAQSGPECGGIATFDAANGTLLIATMLRAGENPGLCPVKLYTRSSANHLCAKTVANRGFAEGLRLL
jgi:hypothetical protein